MILNVTDEQMIQMAKLAILHSRPMGLGFLHYQPMTLDQIDKVEISYERIDIDYYEGRMVKFHARKVGDGKWDVNEQTSYDYQSWKQKFNSYSDLALEVIKNEMSNL